MNLRRPLYGLLFCACASGLTFPAAEAQSCGGGTYCSQNGYAYTFNNTGASSRYGLSLVTNALAIDATTNGPGPSIRAFAYGDSSFAFEAQGGGSGAVYANGLWGYGVYASGWASVPAVLGTNHFAHIGVEGITNSMSQPAVKGTNTNHVGVEGINTSTTYPAIRGTSSGHIGVEAISSSSTQPAMKASATNHVGLEATTSSVSQPAIKATGSNYAIQATTSGSGGYAIHATSSGGHALYAHASGSAATVYVTAGGNNAITAYSSSAGAAGVHAENTQSTGYGVVGRTGIYGTGVYGDTTSSTSGYAGYFTGRVHVAGTLSKGGGSFKIDHPLDPQNKYLYHSFVESPDMMNVYNGISTLGAGGVATVQMPGWFSALNRDFRYQLTCIGQFAPVYISAEINQNNQFSIAGGSAGQRVSWQVTGIRQDRFANQNRIPVEEAKSGKEVGRYLHPTAFGRSESESIPHGPGQ